MATKQTGENFMRDEAIGNFNFRRLFIDVLLVVLACLAIALIAGYASGARTKSERYRVLGTIENIDSTANTITVKLSDGTEKTLSLAERLTVNGREEQRTRAESALANSERAIIYYTEDNGKESAVDIESLAHAM